MQQPTSTRKVKKRAVKRCCYDECTNDSRKNSEKLYFVSFPKPCHGYRQGFITTKTQHVSQCWTCAKCELWVKRCGRVDFQSIDDVTKDSYICSLHFVGGKGPTYDYPDPVDCRKNIFNQVQLVCESKLLTQKNIVSHPTVSESNDCKEDIQKHCIEIKQEPVSPPPEQEDDMNLSTPIMLNEIKTENPSTDLSDNNQNLTASVFIFYPENSPMSTYTSKDGNTNTSKDGNTNTSKGGNTYTSKDENTYTSKDRNTYTRKNGSTYTSKGGNTYTSIDGNTYTSNDGNTYTSKDRNTYTSKDGNTCTSRDRNTYTRKDQNTNRSKDGNTYTSKDGNNTNTSKDGNTNTSKDGNTYTSKDGNTNTSKDGNTYTSKDGSNVLRESIIVKNPMVAHLDVLKKESPLRSQSVQTECERITRMNKRIQVKLRRLSLLNIFENSIKANEKQCKFYTSLNYEQIIILHSLVHPEENFMEMDQHKNERQKSTSLQQLILTLIRLRIRIMIEDLAYRFEIPSTTLSEIVKRWIDILYNKFKAIRPLQFLFPSVVVFQEAPERNAKFESLNKIRVIIDCIEFQCQLPSTVEGQDSCCYCEPKLVYKALIGCTSRGGVCFVSDMYEGNMTCSEIFIKSNLADYLEPGDIVLADIKFAIRDIVESKHAYLNVPPNLNGKDILSSNEELELKLINKQHQYIKHVIARIKNFRFLQTAFPPHLRPLMSKVLYVCACLVNFQPPVVID